MKNNNTPLILTSLLAGASMIQLAGAAAPTTVAATQPEVTPSVTKNIYFWDQAFGLAPQKKVHLYKNSNNPYIQEVNVSLRMQYQAGWVDGQVGNYDGSRNWTDGYRRFRAGWNAKVLNDFKLQNVWNIGGVNSTGSWNKSQGCWDDHSQTSASLYEAFIQYNYKDKGYTFAFGKTNPEIYAENRVSSSSLKVPEFSIVESTVLFDSVWGFWAANDTKKDKLGYYIGIWSGTSDSNKQIWGTWENCFTTVELSYGLDKILLDKGRFYIDWVHSFADADKPLTGRSSTFVGSQNEDVLSAYYIGKQGKFGITVEGLWALKSNNKDVDDMFGLVVLPTYSITDHVEAVARFQFASGDNAVNVGKNRYVKALQRQSPGYADSYYAIGGGFNFYVYSAEPSRLKIMTMMEYCNSTVSQENKAKNAGFTGWQFICGAYLNF